MEVFKDQCPACFKRGLDPRATKCHHCLANITHPDENADNGCGCCLFVAGVVVLIVWWVYYKFFDGFPDGLTGNIFLISIAATIVGGGILWAVLETLDSSDDSDDKPEET
jgi:hypothetical protein